VDRDDCLTLGSLLPVLERWKPSGTLQAFDEIFKIGITVKFNFKLSSLSSSENPHFGSQVPGEILGQALNVDIL
jgi:hypothetical protein